MIYSLHLLKKVIRQVLAQFINVRPNNLLKSSSYSFNNSECSSSENYSILELWSLYYKLTGI